MIYLLEGAGLHKIGSSHEPARRLATLQTGSPVVLELVAAWPGDDRGERALHALFSDRRAHGEWFRFHVDEDPVLLISYALDSEPVIG